MSDELKIKINIDADTKGLKVVNDGLKDVGTKASVSDSEIAKLNNRIKDMAHIGVSVYSVSQAFNFLKTTIKEYISATDEMMNINSKLNLVTDSYKDLAVAQSELFKISQDARVEFGGTVDLYGRIARSTKSLKLENTELFRTVETISKSMVLSGGTAESMNASIVQLGQGFASGTLRGEELNSVMEQTPRLAQAIANGMGIGIGQLRTYAEQGKITSKVIVDALKGQAKIIDSEFSTMNITVSQSMTTFKNALLLTVGAIDESIGLNAKVSTAISGVASNMTTQETSIRDFTINSSAYLGKFADTTYATYLTVENFAQGMVYGLNSTVYGALKVVTFATAKATQGLNTVGLSSKETTQAAVDLYNEMVKQEKIANSGLTESIKETNDAYKKASTSIEDRIKLSEAEYRLSKSTKALQDKIAKKNAPKTPDEVTPKTKEQIDKEKLEKQWQDDKIKLIARENEATETGYQKQLIALTSVKELELKKFGTIKEAKLQIEKTYEAEALAIVTKGQKEETEENIKRWDNYATTMSEITWNQLDNEIKADEKAIEAENKKFEAQHKANIDNIELNNKINSLIIDTYTKETLAENNKLELVKEQLDYQLQKKEISEEYYKKALDTEKDLSKERQKEIEDKKKLNSTAGQFMASLTSDSLKSAAAGAFVDALQNGTSIQQGLAKAGIGMGGNTLAMGMATGNVGMMGAGLAIGAVGALLEKPTETLISQENYLSELTNYSKSILEETKAFRILNKIFDTSYKSDTKSFLTAYGSGYTLNTQVGADMQNYIEGLYSEVANATQNYLVKTGERTVTKSKSGFLGIGASSSTEVQDVWQTFTGQQLSAMQFLSQFGVDGKGSLTADGLSALTNAFNAYNDLVTKLDEYAPNATDVQKLEVALSKIDVNTIKDEMYQTYSNQLSKVGINLAELTIDNIDEAFNATTLGELIKNDPSLNVSQLTGYVSSLNDTYLQQIELTKQLNDAKQKETLSMMEYQKELQGYQDKIDSLSITSVNSYTSVFKTIISSIKSMKDATKSTIDLLGEQDIDRFWELNNQFKGYLDANNYEEASRVLSSLTQLSQNLSQTDAILGGNIATYLSDNMQIFEAKESELRNVIGSGIADLLNFSEAQTTKLGEIIADGKVSKEELSTLNLSDAATLDLQNALADSGLVTVENLLSSINEYSFMQLAELKKANANESDALSVDTFGYLDYIGTTEQFNIASTLGKSYKEVENFILGLQSFDIKNSAEDLEQLKAMINYSFDSATGKVSYNQTAVTDINKLWDVLPQDIKDAYSALNSLAMSQQSGYLSGKETLLSGTFDSNITKEQQDLIDAKNYVGYAGNAVWTGFKNNDAWGYENQDISQEAQGVFDKLGIDPHNWMGWAGQGGATLEAIKRAKALIPIEEQELTTAQTQYNDLLNFINSYQKTQLPSYDVGTSYVRGNQIAQIHDTEMIIDPQSSEVLRKYGIATNVNVSGNNKELLDAINKLILIQNKILRMTEESII